MRNLPLRLRLIAGFSAAMLVLLTAAGAFVYWRVELALDRGLDTELTQGATTITPLVRPDGTLRSPRTAEATGTGWQVLDRSGGVLANGGPAPQSPLVTSGQLARVGSGSRTFDVGPLFPVTRAPYRVAVSALPLGASADAAYLVVGVRRDHHDEALRELLLQLAVAGLGALVVASAVGNLLARAALQPVERYRRRAAEIAEGHSDLRLEVPQERDDEVTRLGHTLNEMLAALDQALARERRFVDEASHELRTPLTLLRSRIQLARRRPRSVAEHEAVLDELAVDVTRLADLTDQLLALGGVAAAGTSDVTALVSALVERRRAADHGRADEVETALPSEPAVAAAPPMVVERIVTNLLDNARTHGAPPVRVRVDAQGPAVVVAVSDAGPGMPPDLLVRATERFARSEEARSRPGAGLGLAIVEQLVRGVGGELRLCSRGAHATFGSPLAAPCDHGDATTATVLLPRAPAAESALSPGPGTRRSG
jgi:signal transduction histidine kinase